MKRLWIVAVMAVLIFMVVPSFAADVTLIWEKPLTNEDGSPYTDHSGYTVHQGTESGVYTTHHVVPGEITTYTVKDLGDGTYFFVVTASDIAGNESDNSNEASDTVNVRPGPPVLKEISVTISGNEVTIKRSEPVAALVIPRLEATIDKINALVIH